MLVSNDICLESIVSLPALAALSSLFRDLALTEITAQNLDADGLADRLVYRLARCGKSVKRLVKPFYELIDAMEESLRAAIIQPPVKNVGEQVRKVSTRTDRRVTIEAFTSFLFL